MSTDTRKAFLTYYVRSLKERTRVEAHSVKTGIDWLIYSLAIAKELRPVRLPFFRQGPDEYPKSKTETEFGIDASFLTQDDQKLVIFVLKDEPLRNSTWTANDFEGDLRRALAPDLTPERLKLVREVEVILAFNKDEDADGVRLFNQFVNAAPSKIKDSISLTITRWNLDSLVEQIGERLMNPNLLPERYFSLFSYICAQFSDFRHGSDQWTNQMIPNWRRFLREVFSENSKERAVFLLPVALLILSEHGKNNPTAATAYIDLMEWAVLECYSNALQSKDPETISAANAVYSGFYKAELERFYSTYRELITKEHVLDHGVSPGTTAKPAEAALRSLWHVARIGIMGLCRSEMVPNNPESIQKAHRQIQETAILLIKVLNASPAASRPLIDLHHIEIFLIWQTLMQADRHEDAYQWLMSLAQNLYLRKIGRDGMVFVHGGSDMEPVWEYYATGKCPPEFQKKSSTLLLMLMMLSSVFSEERKAQLLSYLQSKVVLSYDDFGALNPDVEPLNLMMWHPPDGWGDRILKEDISDDGECIVLDPFSSEYPIEGLKVSSEIEAFVSVYRASRNTVLPEISFGLICLACLKHRTPLPPELWCSSIWPHPGHVQSGSDS